MPVYNVSNFPDGSVVLFKNGFRFTFTMTVDDDLTVPETLLGKWTDEWSEDAFPNDHHDPRSFNYFIPANMPSIEDLMGEPAKMTRKQAIAFRFTEGQAIFKKAKELGITWNYYYLHCSSAVDTPQLQQIVLATSIMGGIDGSANAEYLSDVMFDMMQEIFPATMQRASELAQAFNTLIIKAKDRVDEVIDILENYGATFIVSGLPEHQTPEAIRRWVNDTKDLGDDEFPFPEETSLDEVYKLAVEISKRLLKK